MESRHVDVIEMDAASHNGVDDVRQINEAVRYSPVSARYKVYILDEVHMLSTAAFNALLKTLEEPPPHVKFVFATTEIRKVPITILSRCQRFDLRRVDAALLVRHLEAICAKENISAEPEALALIARAAEGSVRDALSLMDQGIAHAAGGVRAEDVRQMLGLADRTRVIDLFEALMRGDMAQGAGRTARSVRFRRRSGGGAVRPRRVHAFRHAREGRAGGRRRSFARRGRAHARARFRDAALDARAVAHLADAVQGADRGAGAPAKPLAAAEMVLVRIAYAADLPTPDEVIRDVAERRDAAPRARRGNGGGARAAGRRRRGSIRRAAAPRASLAPAQLVTAQVPDIADAARRAGAAPTLAVASFAGADRARGREARPRAPRRRSSATCGWCASRTASWRSRSSRARARRW